MSSGLRSEKLVYREKRCGIQVISPLEHLTVDAAHDISTEYVPHDDDIGREIDARGECRCRRRPGRRFRSFAGETFDCSGEDTGFLRRLHNRL